MHSPQLVIKLRKHDAARHVICAKQMSYHRQGLTGIGQLPAHQHDQTKSKKDEKQAGKAVLEGYGFMVGRKQVFPFQTVHYSSRLFISLFADEVPIPIGPLESLGPIVEAILCHDKK